MINKFLQFLKKQKFVNNFARADLLFLLRPLQTFKSQLPLAAFFVRPSDLRPGQRIKAALAEDENRLLALFAPALALNYGICPPEQKAETESSRIRRALSVKDRRFFETLIAELLARDLNNFALEDWLHTLDLNYDLRLYGSELERILTASSGHPAALSLAVDWRRSSKAELWLNSLPEGCVMSFDLPLPAQQNLADLFLYLLFAKGIFPADWRWVALAQNNQVMWTDFSAVFPADSSLKNYALEYIRHGTEPQDSLRQNLVRAIRLLKLCCPQIDLVRQVAAMSVPPREEASASSLSLNILRQNGFPSANAQAPASNDPHDFAYLLDSRRHRKNPLFRKSSFLYWGPLLLAMILLYYYF